MKKKSTNKKAKKLTTRVTIDFPIDEHRRLKALVAMEGMTLQGFILACVEGCMSRKSKKFCSETAKKKSLLSAAAY
ncbi:MAG: hypothetical protein V4487_08580 [Chlamydiota bacterium]